MGVDGCGWVRWGAGGMSNPKSRQKTGVNGASGQYLGAMAGEFSPDIMFGGVKQKSAYMGSDACKLFWMGAYAPIGKGESKNKGARGPCG